MDYKCVQKIEEIKTYLKNKKIVAFDFETAPLDEYRKDKKAALDSNKSRIAGISFSVEENTGIYIPLNHKGSTNCNHQEELWHFLKNNIFCNKEITKVAHNLAFEAMFLYSKGIIIKSPCYDTIAASQLTLKNKYEFRWLRDSGLKTLANEFLEANLPDFNTITEGKYFDELDPNNISIINYACSDSDYTLRLYYLFNKWFENNIPRHKYIVSEIESPAAIYTGIMKHNGLIADENLMIEKQKEAEEKIASLKRKIEFLIGDVKIGKNASTKAFKDYIYKDLELPILKITEKDNASLDDNALILLREWCEKNKPNYVNIFKLVQEYRRWQKLKSTYIDGYLKEINSATGKIHPDLLQLSTVTGRFASRNPNLQNMPRIDGDLIGVRNFIVAGEGNVLLSLDFSQIELRVGAFYCKDEAMLKTYENDGDIHAQTTSVIYKIPFSEANNKENPKYNEMRSIAKNCNFGVFYGLYEKGLQRNLKFKAGLDISLDECRTIIKNLKEGYPKLSSWQKQIIVLAKSKGYIETYLGRRRYLPEINNFDFVKRSSSERYALNTPIQGTAADILKLAMGRIIENLDTHNYVKPLLQIHDELVFEIPKDKINEAIKYIKTCMEQKPFEDFDLRIKAEESVGLRFGEMTDVEVWRIRNDELYTKI